MTLGLLGSDSPCLQLAGVGGVEVGARMSEDTHSHVALSHGEGLRGQHVRLHQILHVDPVHACPAIPKPEHEKSLLDVALVQGRGQCRLTGCFTLYLHTPSFQSATG